MSEGGSTVPRLSAAASEIRQSVFAALQGRIDAHRAAGGSLIPLQIGDTYLDPPVPFLEAELRDLAIYGAVGGLDELRAELAAFRRGRGLAAATSGETVHVGCGCTHALFCAARALLDPGDEVIVISPFWPLIPGLLQAAGAEVREVSAEALGLDQGLDVSALERARTSRTRAIYYVSPNNPDGRVFTAEALEVIARFARESDLWVLADEVYADFVYDGVHRHIADLPEMAERTVSTFSLSKSHGLAGARIGYVVAPPRLIAATRRMSNHTVYNVPVAMQRVALSAVRSGAAWIDEARETYRRTRDESARALDALGFRYRMPEGGSFFFLDFREVLGRGSLTPLLERAIDAGVLLAPGEAFGQGYERFARLCFTGVVQDEVLEGIRRLGMALEGFS